VSRRLRKGVVIGVAGLLALLAAVSAGGGAGGDFPEGEDPEQRGVSEIARRMSIAGTVKVEVVVAANGSVKSSKVVGGHPVLATAALDAVKKWKFEPASEETTGIVGIQFQRSSERPRAREGPQGRGEQHAAIRKQQHVHREELYVNFGMVLGDGGGVVFHQPDRHAAGA